MAVARNNRHNAAFVVGSVVGAVAGAAVALWKTPYTGEELRSKLTGAGAHEGGEARTYAAPASTGATTVGQQPSIKDKVLSGVEKTLAPIVGVELGKTANGSGTTATPMDSGDIKVSQEYGSTMLRHPHAWKDGEEAATTTGTETGTFGLSRDKVDAEKWAKAYGTSADTAATSPSVPAADTTPQGSDDSRLRPKRSWTTGSETVATPSEPVKAETESAEYGSTLLRHPHAWKDGDEASTAADTQSGTLGLSRDKVDAEKWAKAYGTDVPAGTTGTTGSGYTSKAEESAAQTGLGAKPAYPGSDQTGHEPVDRTAPDSNVADVGSRDADIRTDSGLTSEDAASVDALTTPQIDRVPDSMREPDEGGYHPFPKLGGKDS